MYVYFPVKNEKLKKTRHNYVHGENMLAVLYRFLSERDYVTFGSLLSQFRLSSVYLSPVTLVHPTQEVEAFGNISSPLCTLATL